MSSPPRQWREGRLYSLGASTLPFAGRGLKEAAETIRDLGFDAWEVIVDDELSQEEVEGLKETVETLGLKTSIHAPFSDLNIASLNHSIREVSLTKMEEAVEAAAVLDAGPVTVHAGRFSPTGLFHPEKVVETNIRSLRRLRDFGDERGVRVCMENSPRFPGVLASTLEEISGILEGVPGMGITLDIGHAHTCGHLGDYLKGLSGHIEHLHLHDNDTEKDHHLHLGGGTMDLGTLGRFLKGFSGSVVIETHEIEDIEKSKWVLDDILG